MFLFSDFTKMDFIKSENIKLRMSDTLEYTVCPRILQQHYLLRRLKKTEIIM